MDRVIGLLVNPVAGVGGPVGLKGSDGADVQAQALARGSTARAGERAVQALQVVAAEHPDMTILTVAGAMGADAVTAAGLSARVVYTAGSPTTDSDTTAATQALVAAGAGLVLFVGGDGTARDVAAAIASPHAPSPVAPSEPEHLRAPGDSTIRSLRDSSEPELSRSLRDSSEPEHFRSLRDSSEPASPNRLEGSPRHPVPILGVPAGVKMYSGCFAVSPPAAGALAARWIADPTLPLAEREVLDVDEDQIREGRVDPRLYALVSVPFVVGRTQSRKSATGASEAAAVGMAARGAIDAMCPGTLYLLGPGGTCREIARQLGVANTPLGVDVVRGGAIVRLDASESELLEMLAGNDQPAKAMVTVIGGQGFLLGRGNQQLSARVLRALGPDPLIVVATEAKITALASQPLLVDTGDTELDRTLAGYIRVTTGMQSSLVYPVAAA